MTTPLDLAAWIDSVQAKLNERLGHVAPGPPEDDVVVSIAYWREGKGERPTTVPRVIWDEEPDHEFGRELRGANEGIGTWTDLVTVECVGATTGDCRALAVDLIQCILLVSDPPELRFPIKGGTRMHDVAQHGRRAKKLVFQIGISFTVPDDPMSLATHTPIGPTEEAAIEAFESTVGGDTWTQPKP